MTNNNNERRSYDRRINTGRRSYDKENNSTKERLEEVVKLGVPFIYFSGNDLMGRNGISHELYENGSLELILNKKMIDRDGKYFLLLADTSEEAKKTLKEMISSDGKRFKLKSSHIEIHGLYDKTEDNTYYFMLPVGYSTENKPNQPKE